MLFTNRLYDVLKWFCLVCIPALNAFLGILLPATGAAPSTTNTVITVISALGAFIGTLIGISTNAYKMEAEIDE